GVRPATEFIEGLEKAGDGSINVDDRLRAADGIYAAGDIARFPDWRTGNLIRVEHWRLACQHGRIAGYNLAGVDTPYRSVPFFWTMQFGTSIRYVGHATSWDEIIYDGSPDDRKFVAFYVEDGHVLAASACGRDRDLAAIEELCRRDRMPSPDELRRGGIDYPALLKDGSLADPARRGPWAALRQGRRPLRRRQFVQDGRQQALRHDPRDPTAHHPLAIHDDRRRQRVHAAELHGHVPLIEEDGIVEADLVGKPPHGLRSVVIQRDADDHQLVRAVLGLQLDQVGNLDATGRAPCRPEIDQDDLAALLRHPELTPVEHRQGEIGRRRGLRVVIRKHRCLPGHFQIRLDRRNALTGHRNVDDGNRGDQQSRCENPDDGFHVWMEY